MTRMVRGWYLTHFHSSSPFKITFLSRRSSLGSFVHLNFNCLPFFLSPKEGIVTSIDSVDPSSSAFYFNFIFFLKTEGVRSSE